MGVHGRRRHRSGRVHLWALDRCSANSCAGSDLDPILEFDPNGNVVTSFDGAMMFFPHGIHVDREGNVWVTDGPARPSRPPSSSMTRRAHMLPGLTAAAATCGGSPSRTAPPGRLLDSLDDQVGAGRWVLAFSADHGVVEIPEHLADEGVLAGRISRDQRIELAGRIQAAAAGGEWAIREAIASLRFVAGAYTFEEIERDQPSDSFAVLYAHSHSRTRRVGSATRARVYVRYSPNFLADASITTHGTPYYYDRHVPLIFLGAGIGPGASAERAATVDVAPTLARLAGVTVPADLDGRAIPAVVGP